MNNQEIENFKKQLELENRSNHTVRAYISTINNYFTDYNLNEQDLIKYIQEEIAKGLTMNTINRNLAAIKKYAFFTNNSIDWKNIIQPKFKEKSKINYFNKSEIYDFLNSIQDTRYKIILWLAYEAGLKASEVCSLNIDVISIKNKTANINNTIIPLSPELVDNLKQYIKNKEGLLFSNSKGKKIDSNYLSSIIFKKLCTRDMKFSDFTRKSRAINLLADGISIEVVKTLLRYNKIENVTRYLPISINQ